ncbi:uncharacterized protein LOC126905410 [Daktulosphaira vitifoliae]|uniref:uncharacterized protein LOC126905410 n=1 Tax=Daktulosphaira vitifoliae TaxID=58002 RepID=UPI0021AA2FDE|nr:uncharacterized protein LOC126905410 [Daktulosphaira vitifoliae]
MIKIILLNFCLLGMTYFVFSVPFGIRRLNDAVFSNPLGTKQCKVSGVYYNHSQKILFTDRCKTCLCIDGQIFCYWQCDETTTEVINDVLAVEVQFSSPATSLSTTIVESEENPTSTISGLFSTMNSPQRKKIISNLSNKTTNEQFCVVMGVKYKLGSVLPRDTGSCLECQCGQNSQITCSPKDCITLNTLNDENTSEPEFYGNRNDEQNNENFNLDMFAVNIV